LLIGLAAKHDQSAIPLERGKSADNSGFLNPYLILSFALQSSPILRGREVINYHIKYQV
jgi:hypothetical protein